MAHVPAERLRFLVPPRPQISSFYGHGDTCDMGQQYEEVSEEVFHGEQPDHLSTLTNDELHLSRYLRLSGDPRRRCPSEPSL